MNSSIVQYTNIWIESTSGKKSRSGHLHMVAAEYRGMQTFAWGPRFFLVLQQQTTNGITAVNCLEDLKELMSLNDSN